MGRYAVCLVGLLLVCGCSSSGPRRASVSGVVQLDGEIIEEGSIQFIPVEGTLGPESGAAIRKGKYTIPRDSGVTVGKNRVELRATRKTGKKIQDPTGKPGVLTDELVEAFPKEFNESSTLTREIKEDNHALDFLIKTKP